MMEPFDRIKSVVKMEADEIKVTTTSQSGTIKIMTPSQINKPLDKVVSKNRGPPFIIGRVGNTTVKPIIRFLSNEPNKPTVTAHSSLKLLLHPKENEEISTARPSGAYVKHIENENRDLRKLLTDVRRESIGVQQKMIRMQEVIDKMLQRKPVVPNQTRFYSTISNKQVATIPSFSITNVEVFLQFEKDLGDDQFFPIVFQRILKTCKFYLKNINVLGTCLKVLISNNILTHFEWDSIRNEYHSLSKCMNFLRLFHKVVDAITQDRRIYTRPQIVNFLRQELMKEPKARNTVQTYKFPKLSTEQTSIIRNPTSFNAKVAPNRVLVHKIPHRIIHNPVSTTRTSFIGIDDVDLQSEITSTEIDLNLVKDSDENHCFMNNDNDDDDNDDDDDDNDNDDDDDNEMQNSKNDDDYEKPEIETHTNNINCGDSAASIIELHSDNAESGFEIVNC